MQEWFEGTYRCTNEGGNRQRDLILKKKNKKIKRTYDITPRSDRVISDVHLQDFLLGFVLGWWLIHSNLLLRIRCGSGWLTKCRMRESKQTEKRRGGSGAPVSIANNARHMPTTDRKATSEKAENPRRGKRKSVTHSWIEINKTCCEYSKMTDIIFDFGRIRFWNADENSRSAIAKEKNIWAPNARLGKK